MKECPLCHTQYDDSVKFCLKDGQRLIPVQEEKDTEAKQETLPSPDTNSQAEKETKPISSTIKTESGDIGNSDSGNANEPKKERETANGQENKKSGGILRKILIGIAATAAVAVAVFQHLNNAATYLRTEPGQIIAPKCGGAYTVDIDYDGYFWHVNHTPDWASAVKKSGYFDLYVFSNTTGEVQEGAVSVQSGKQVVLLPIRQNAFATYIKADKTSVKFPKEGGEDDVLTDSDGCGWEIYASTWLVLSEGEHNLHIECPENDDTYRTCTITLKEDNAELTIFVSQGGKCNVCGGKGTIPCTVCGGLGGFGYGAFYTPCSWCGGSGQVTCGTCQGTGEIE